MAALSTLALGLSTWYAFRPGDAKPIINTALISVSAFFLVKLTGTLLSDASSPLGNLETFFWLPLIYIVSYTVPDLALGRKVARLFFALFIAVSAGFVLSPETQTSATIVWALVQLNVANAVMWLIARVFLGVRSKVERELITEDVTHDLSQKDGLLTDFYNRRAARTLLEDAGELTVILVDVDTSRTLATHASELSDKYMLSLARALRAVALEGDELARMGEMELCLIRPGQFSKEDLTQVSIDIFEAVSAEGANTLNLAVGAASGAGKELVTYAKLALSEATRRPLGHRVHLFDPVEDAGLVKVERLKTVIKDAVCNEAFHLVYQPIVNLASQEPVYVEALARWIHDEHGFVPPDEFIPLIEADLDNLIRFEAWLMRKACCDVNQLNSDLGVSINISPKTFAHPNFVFEVVRAIKDSGIKHTKVQLEITESSTLSASNESQVHRNFEALRELGIRVALDDFGSGYASLAYLHRYEFSTIKIDREFALAGEQREGYGRSLYLAVAAIAKEVGADVVAEGLEDPDGAHMFLDYGVTFGQGYGFSRPIKLDDLKRYLLSFPMNRFSISA